MEITAMDKSKFSMLIPVLPHMVMCFKHSTLAVLCTTIQLTGALTEVDWLSVDMKRYTSSILTLGPQIAPYQMHLVP